VRHEGAEGGLYGYLKQPCCTRDEGRPLGLGLQGQGPNHLKLLWHNGRGGERSRKRRDLYPSGVRWEDERSEPLRTCRKRRDVIETELQSLARDELGGSLLTARVVTGTKTA
jgi:hypothetical protein